MDATPLTLDKFFLYTSQINHGIKAIENTLSHLSEIALGEQVGTGINTPKGYSKLVAKYISKFTELPFISAKINLKQLQPMMQW